MDTQQYRKAVTSLLDRQAPDVHMEVLLIYGARPSMFESDRSWHEWITNVAQYMCDRHGYNEQSAKHLEEVATVIANRIKKEQQRVEVRS